MSHDVTQDMLNVVNLDQHWKYEYIIECLNDPSRFEKPIKRQKVKNLVKKVQSD